MPSEQARVDGGGGQGAIYIYDWDSKWWTLSSRNTWDKMGWEPMVFWICLYLRPTTCDMERVF